ncbi:hypothetical protein PVAP13_1NG390000 [Panicum virgatum]|uniref:Uncharacterized protein n=1 Tax=Panicum virgatum TaxID=38727 RepID=A0A8T0WYE0_PANVG|nr:hypothetical protein PVAP13_1NG390000 [Panicum virgatum]
MPSSLLITYPCLLRDQYKQLQHSYMFSLSSTLALKEQLKPSTTTTVLLVVFILTLYVTACEGRHLGVHGKDYPSKLPPSPPKGGIDDDFAANGKMSNSPEVPVGSNMLDASSMTDDEAVTEARKEMASSGDSCRGSLRKRFQWMKVVRSSLRERSVLGAESNSEQVGSNVTTAYTAEALVAMDYLDAHPAPAVHNR